MILDILFILILLICGINGFRKGFLHTIIHLLGWVASIVIAFFATPYAKKFILDYTSLYDEIIPPTPIAMDIPKGIGDLLFETVSDTIFTVIIFFVIFIALKILIWFLLHLMTTKDKKSLTGVVDGTFGFILGLIKGFLAIFVIIAVIMPLSEIFLPDLVVQIETLLSTSQFAQTIYDYNPIWFLGR